MPCYLAVEGVENATQPTTAFPTPPTPPTATTAASMKIYPQILLGRPNIILARR